MRTTILLLPLLIVLTACGKSLDYSVQIEPTLYPQVEAFQQTALSNGRQIDLQNIVIAFDTNGVTSEAKPGHCTLGPKAEILINRAYFIKVSPWTQRELMFHELGHCVLGKHHDDSKLNIMNTYLMGQFKYNELTYAQYDVELFK